MKDFINRLYEAARAYSIADFGVLKLCLFAIGVWTGVSNARILRPELRLVRLVAITSYAYIMYTTFRKMCRDSGKK